MDEAVHIGFLASQMRENGMEAREIVRAKISSIIKMTENHPKQEEKG